MAAKRYYRAEGANGDFVKHWATRPYLWTRPKLVSTEHESWRQAQPYELARDFFFAVGNQPECPLAQGRGMSVLLPQSFCRGVELLLGSEAGYKNTSSIARSTGE